MPRTFVVNASPFILLKRVGRLDLLGSLAEKVLVPAAVLKELADGQHHDDTADIVRATSSIDVVVVLDDLAARRCARSLGLATIGTLGVVITCRHNGVITTARPLLEELRLAGMRLKTTLMNDALKKVGE